MLQHSENDNAAIGHVMYAAERRWLAIGTEKRVVERERLKRTRGRKTWTSVALTNLLQLVLKKLRSHVQLMSLYM